MSFLDRMAGGPSKILKRVSFGSMTASPLLWDSTAEQVIQKSYSAEYETNIIKQVIQNGRTSHPETVLCAAQAGYMFRDCYDHLFYILWSNFS